VTFSKYEIGLHDKFLICNLQCHSMAFSCSNEGKNCGTMCMCTSFSLSILHCEEHLKKNSLNFFVLKIWELSIRNCPILYSLLPVSSWPSSPWHRKITSPCTTCFLFLLPRSTAQLQVHEVEVSPSPNLFCWQNFSPEVKLELTIGTP
jgi:hypothetical protein